MNTGTDTRPSLGTTIGLLITLFVVTAAWLSVVYGSLSAFTSCTDRCNFSAGPRALDIVLWTSVAVMVLSVTGVSVLHARQRASWWVPTVGIVAVSAASVVALGMVSGAAVRS